MKNLYKNLVIFSALLLAWAMPLSAELRLENSSVSSSAAFEWDAVPDADRYLVWVGSAAGTGDLGKRTAFSVRGTINQLPTDGSDLHATLRARVNGRWVIDSSLVFSAASASLINSPTKAYNDVVPKLRGAAARFAWNRPGDGSASSFLLMAGTLEDVDAYGRRRAIGNDQFASLTNLPVDGRSLWVTLLWRDHLNLWRREKPVEFQASVTPSITYPVAGSQLAGSAEVVEVQPIQSTERSRLRIGTADAPTAYRAWYGSGYQSSFAVAGLPLDGSDVVIRHDFYDGRRWVNASQLSYQAGFPSDFLWGDCTVADAGRRLRQTAAFLPSPEEEAGISRATVLGVVNGRFDPKLYRVLTDGCASDSDYITIESINIYLDSSEKGLFLWLAPDSGEARLEYINSFHSSGPISFVRAIHPADGINRPIFIPLLDAKNFTDGLAHGFRITPLDDEKPVKISEIRSVGLGTPVTSYRKLRIGGSPYFTAMSGDPRARVTAAIAREFGPVHVGGEGAGPNYDTCGYFKWIDATWITDQGITVDGYYTDDGTLRSGTIWVNWALVTNAELVSMIDASVQAGVARDYYYYTCTPAPYSSYNIDWLAEAQSALDGTYDGPVLIYE